MIFRLIPVQSPVYFLNFDAQMRVWACSSSLSDDLCDGIPFFREEFRDVIYENLP